jgi:hypothetical protein
MAWPGVVPCGQFFEFRLNHIVALDDPFELVRIEYIDLAPRPTEARKEAVHG